MTTSTGRIGYFRPLMVLFTVLLAACADGAAVETSANTSSTLSPEIEATEIPSASVGRALGTLAPDQRPVQITVVASGDVLIHQSVWESAQAYADGDGFDFGPMFEPVAPFIAGPDLAICHLEVPLSPDNSRLSSFPMFNAPFELADAIAGAGFDGCSVASNHTLDRGVAGIDSTLGHLDRVGVGHAGAARSAEEAEAITTYTIRGHRVAHLSYTYGFNGLRRPADELWRSNLIDAATILADAGRARSEGADIVLVSLHWGDEYRHAPNAYQRQVAAAVGDSPDIDFIIGHHAHVLQPVEQVGNTWVAYGLGNQLSNMLQPERRDGVLLAVTFEAAPGEPFTVVAMEMLPTWVEIPGHRIVPAPPDSWDRTVGHMRALGAPVETVPHER